MLGVRASGGFTPEGRPFDAKNSVQANLRLAGPGFFETMRIPLRRGRDFTDRDDAAAPKVIIVNESFAQRAWPGESPIGKRVYGPGEATSSERTLWEVVGIAADTHEDGLREERRPAIFYPLEQVPPILWDAMQRSMFIIARTSGDPLAITKSVQNAVMGVDRTLPVFSIRSMEQRMSESLATARFNTQLLTVLGTIGLVLAVVGIYGVIGYFVTQRTQEIGVRVALGATPRDILALVVGQGMRPVLLGIALGAAAAAAATRVLASQLYGIGRTDPLTFAGVALVLALAAVVASVIPARRAAKVDPKTVLT
jgi:predicted permease